MVKALEEAETVLSEEILAAKRAETVKPTPDPDWDDVMRRQHESWAQSAVQYSQDGVINCPQLQQT